MTDIVERLRVHTEITTNVLHEAAEEIERLRKTLQEIADPIKFMKMHAENNGLQIDGIIASMLSNDPNHLKNIAEKALRQ